MGQIVTEVTIARPPDAVFDYLRDYANEGKWQSGHVTIESVDPPGPARVGTRVQKVRQAGGKDQRFTVEIVEMDEQGRRWKDITTTGAFKGSTGQWSVSAEGDGSRVKLIADMRGSGLYRLMTALIDRSARRSLESELRTLKETLEAG